MLAKCLQKTYFNDTIWVINKEKGVFKMTNTKIINENENVVHTQEHYLANDVGNNKMKVMEMQDEEMRVWKIESAYRRLNKLPDVQELDLEKNVLNLMDNLVVNITSQSIERSGLYSIGKKATAVSKNGLYNMDIESAMKHKEDFVLIGTLGFISARAIQKEFKTYGVLQDIINVNVFMSTAIPASQHNAITSKELKERFTNNKHTVIVYFGDQQVTVNVKFKKVFVTKEGVPALYSIYQSEKDMFKEFNDTYNLNWTGENFAEKQIFHTDIGSGTTEYVYTVGSNPVPDRCSGERKGVGHAIESAIPVMELRRNGININRQQYSEYLENPELHPKNSNLAKSILEDVSFEQSDSILASIIKKNKIEMANETEIFAVYGGGSIPFKEEMYNKLFEYAKKEDAKLLWIPEKYAVDMNVKGLDILNKNVFFPNEL